MRMPSNRIKLIAIVSALVGTAAVFLAQSHTIAGGAKPKSEERRAKVRNVIVMREIKFSSDWN
ncbi:MAG: hypothetical protein QGD94_00220, partial [Planctomycetia bacterium]|nr:hypothetical protein [Planctomycetia bacterium]